MSSSGNTLERGREGAGIRLAPQGLSLKGQRETRVGGSKNRMVLRNQEKGNRGQKLLRVVVSVVTVLTYPGLVLVSLPNKGSGHSSE